MTRVSTAASEPTIQLVSTAKALQTAARSGRLEKLGDAILHPLRARKLQASRFPSSCEKVGKKKRTLANRFSPFHAQWPSEKSKFMNFVRSLSTSKASTLLSADKPLQSQNSQTDVACNSRVLRVTDFVSSALRRLASSGMLSAIFTSSRTRARPRRCKTRARPADFLSSSLLLTKLLAAFASRRLQPTVLRLFCHGTEGFGKEVSLDSDSVRCRERFERATARFTTEPCVRYRESLSVMGTEVVYQTLGSIICAVMFSAAPVTAVELARYPSDADPDVPRQTHRGKKSDLG